MRPTVLSLATSTRWVENTTRHLRSIAQRRTIFSLMSLTLGGIVPLAMAQNATRPDLSTTSAAAVVHGHRIRNIVLVHGAWADGSGWRGVYDILVKDGFNVSIVQEPETSFQEDVTATKRVLALQDGPSILVAHSYGGSVVTEAGTDPSVAGLVYVRAVEEVGDDSYQVASRSISHGCQSLGLTICKPDRDDFCAGPP
jgi:pimeloyl-ACP methyl ester carboxylesterase